MRLLLNFPTIYSQTKTSAKNQIWTLFISAAIICGSVGQLPAQCTSANHPDVVAMVTFYDATNGASWMNKTGWEDGKAGTNCDPCNGWYGVTCVGNRVTCIDLDGTVGCSNTTTPSGNGLTGNLPDLNLPMLEDLYLGGNNISGSIPNFSFLTDLINLNLNDNNFNGSIPNFSNLNSLVQFDCARNNLTGSIPDFSNLSGLEFLFCSENNLSGNIPEFTNVNDLKQLSCAWNSGINGNLPAFSSFSNMTEFYASHCDLTGAIPDYSHMSSLTALWINNNDLSGCFPPNACTVADFNADFNSQLPWEGDESNLCSGDPEFEAPCDDGNSGNGVDLINTDCSCGPCNHPDFDALMDFYNATGGSGWTDNSGWVDGAAGTNCDPCSWYGVSCNGSGRVTCLDLDGIASCDVYGNGNNLSGTIPDINLPFLEKLYLSVNNLSGSIPDFSNLSALKEFYCWNNQLSGSIPDFSNLPNLEEFDCSENQLSGSIPDFSNLDNLKHFYCSFNQLSGNIPNFSNLSALQFFSCRANQISGSIPNFSNLSNLQVFHCNSNQLSNSIPNFSNLPNLADFQCQQNQLTGNIPNFLNISNLTTFYCTNNSLSGCYPNSICNIPVVSSLNNPELPWQGDHTNFCNGDPQIGAPCDAGGANDEIQTDCSCGSCTHPDKEALKELYEFTDGDNWTNTWDTTSCNVCDWYGVECLGTGRVQRLELKDNDLTGTLPDLDLPTMYELDVSENNISGTIPNFSNLPVLEELWLNLNQFSGSIPDFSNLPFLEVLYLEQNQLTGSIPDFSNTPLLRIYFCALNQLSGNIPDFSNTPALEDLVCAANNLTGSIPDFSNLPVLDRLHVEINQLTSNIPDLASCPLLNEFHGNDNQLSGCFPAFTCNISIFDALNNIAMPWQGDHTNFCNGDPQIGAPCDAGGTNDEILTDCSCGEACPTITPNVIASNNPICPGASVDLTFTFSDGTGPYDVTYTDGTNSYNLNSIPDGHIETIFPSGTGTFDYEVISGQDANGCTFDPGNVESVDVLDTQDPSAACHDISVDLDASGNATITASDIDAGSGDNCTSAGDLIFTLDNSTFDCSNLGFNNVNMTVEDESGNMGSCLSIVNIQDITPPNAACQDISVVLDANGNASIFPSDIDDGSFDVCTAQNDLTLSIDISNFNCSNLGTENVTLTVEDESNNFDDCIATVTISETEPPSAACQDITLDLDASGNASITYFDINAGSGDNCTATGDLIFTLDISDFDCSDIGIFPQVEMIVEDESGNSASCFSTITVQDIDDPSPDFCPFDITICEGEVVNYPEPTFVDNCGGSGQFGFHDFGPLNGDQPPFGTYDVRYYFDDLGGNTQAECIFSIEVNPVPNEPDPPVETVCSGGFLTLFGPLGYDTYQWDDGSTFEDRDVFSDGTYFLTITENSCEQVLTYQVDLAPPIDVDIIGPQIVFVDQTITLQEDPPTPNVFFYDWQILSGDGDVEIIDNGDGTADIIGLFPGTVEIEYFVTDDFGCEGTATHTLEIPNCIDENLPVTVEVFGNRTVCINDMVDITGEVYLQNGDVIEGVWTHDGTGSLSSNTANSTIYTPNVNDGGQTVTFFYTATDPDGSGPCTVNPNDHYDLDNIMVSSPIDPPIIICTSTSNEITFSWSSVPGASSYDIFIENVPQGNQTNTDFIVSGLNPGDEITIQVDAVPSNNVCPSSSATLTCFAQNCPTITVDVTPVPDICLTTGTQVIQMQATQNGGSGNGTFTWSGTGMSSGGTGDIFNPHIANIGANLITVIYEENNCTFSANTTIFVYQTPTADFFATSPVCEEAPSILTYTGNALSNAQFVWNTDGGNPQMPGTIGPHNVTWSAPGSKSVTLTVTENGCVSSTETQSVTVEPQLTDPVVTCTSTTSSITFSWAPVTGVNEYAVSINGGTAINQTATTFTENGLNPGENIEISVTAISTSSCPSATTIENCSTQNCPPVMLNITPVAPICRTPSSQILMLTSNPSGGMGGGNFVWSGNGTTPDGNFDPNSADIGINIITLEYSESNCVYTETTNIEINETPTADFSIPASVCITEPAQLTYTGNATSNATYIWNTNGGIPANPIGQGPHQINWVNPGNKNITLSVEENGCTSVQNTQTLAVESELQAPVINCLSTQNDITFSWNPVVGASEYSVSINSGAPIVQSTTTYVESGLNPGDNVEISVTAISSGSCPSTTTVENCIAQSCPTVDLNIDPIPPVCRESNAADIQLSANPTGGLGGGSFVWSGSGIINSSGIFNGQNANLGINTITLEYTEGSCIYREGINIRVNQTPTADFLAESVICILDVARIQYLGNASNTADFNWDFQNGNIISGSNGGTHEISWNTPGTKEITLIVSENGCVSAPVSQQTEVEPELQTPVINCIPSQNDITFSWDPIVGANEYSISINGGVPAVQASATFIESGLNPGDNVEISVTAISTNNCPSTISIENCVAQSCPTVDLNIAPVAPICQESNTPNIQLSANPSGGTGNGNFVWSGTGITGASGIFDPKIAAIGSNTVTLEYNEGTCIYLGTLDIEINQVPTAEFTAPTEICLTEAATIRYTGNASPDADFNWDFAGGNINSGANSGPFEINWNNSGINLIMLSVEENGCNSTLFEQQIEVVAPLEKPIISCTSTTSSVSFIWDSVSGATEYEISINGGIPFTQSATDFTENNLTAGDNISIEVRAIASGHPCGASEPESAFCIAQDCPPVDITIEPVADICRTAGTTPIQLIATTQGGTGNGNFIWNGTGVDANGLFYTSLASLGSNQISVDYSEDNCNYSAAISINVFDVPTADFSAEANICINSTSYFEYLGTATDPNAGFNFDLDGGNFTSGNSRDGWNANWSVSGIKNITLTVTENGCTSLPFSQTVKVEPELPAPNINCSSTISSITFSWDAIPNADDYSITIGGANPVTQTNLSYTVTGLQPNESVNIEVTANGSTICGSSLPGTTSCMAQNCPPVAVNISPVPNICFTSTVGPIQLDATQSGGIGSGTWAWSGIGTDQTGLFDPQISGVGEHTITCEYSEGSCNYRSTVNISVIEIPRGGFTAASPICETETSTITFIGTVSPLINLNWTLDGGSIVSTNRQSPIEVSWDIPGSKNIILELDDRGCKSTSSGEVTVDPKLEDVSIICQNPTATSAGFAWNDDSNVTEYEIFVKNASGVFESRGRQNSTGFEVSGLPQNTPTDVTIRVVAIGNNTCPNTEAEFTCQNSDCPPLSFFETEVCLNDSIEINGTWYSRRRPSGTEVFILDNGCDSLVRVQLAFHDQMSNTFNDDFCEGDFYELPSGKIVNEGRTYHDTLQSAVTGCDSIVIVNLTEIKISEFILENDVYDFDPDSIFIHLYPTQNDSLSDDWFLDFDQLLPEVGELEQQDSVLIFELKDNRYRGTATFTYRICRFECPDDCPEAEVVINLPGDCFAEAKENIPNAIRPESNLLRNQSFDPLQEFIDLQCIEPGTPATLTVVNRWGDLVFKNSEYLPWDGNSLSGQLMPQGVYYYSLKILHNEKKLSFKGPVNLIH